MRGLATGRRGALRRRLAIRGPAPTISFRLTALYGTVFLVTGGVLLTIGYLLVRNDLRGHHEFRSQLRQLGLTRPAGAPFGLSRNSPEDKIVRAVQQQIVGDALHRLLIEYVVAPAS